MPDHAAGPLQRIALVFGETAAAAHVRDAVAGHAEIVYAAAAADFDPAHANAAHAAAVLVNLDGGGDWLSAIEARLHEVDAHVVYNDSEISGGLEGWERARWLRHLLAKLRGSNDVDPPRPAAPMAVPAAGDGDPGTATDGLAPGVFAEAESGVPPDAAPAAGDGTEDPAPLDVDTEALSAALDARLAESDTTSQEGGATWRVAPRGPEPPAADAAPANEPVEQAGAVAQASAGAEATPAPDESDPFAKLSSLDDWELVDPESVTVPAPAPKAPEPELPDNFPDLELVPMDIHASDRPPTEPIERWLDRSHRPDRTGPKSRKPGATDPEDSAP